MTYFPSFWNYYQKMGLYRLPSLRIALAEKKTSLTKAMLSSRDSTPLIEI